MDLEQFDILEIGNYPSKKNIIRSNWVHNQAVRLYEFGYKPIVLSPTSVNPLRYFVKKFKNNEIPSTNIENYNDTFVIRPPFLNLPKNKFFNKYIGFYFRELSNCICKYGNMPNIRLIHAHFGHHGCSAIKLKKRINVPLITSFYGYDLGLFGNLYRPFYQQLSKDGDLFLALSNDMKSDLLSFGFPEEKIIVHHLGINTDDFCPQETNNSKIIITTTAMLDEKKGVHIVLKALGLFLNRHPNERNNIEYRIIGGGSFEAQLRELVMSEKLTDIVTFIDNRFKVNSRQIVRDEMQMCDIFCLCSYTTDSGSKEGTPVVLMEAQACGKPCIATYHAGIPEVVINGQTGILVDEKDVESTMAAIEKLYFDTSLRNKYGQNATTHIKQEFNQQIQMRLLNEIYLSMINQMK
jgi:colanic acid/amylovoran biosynthesis glycosyltransferase